MLSEVGVAASVIFPSSFRSLHFPSISSISFLVSSTPCIFSALRTLTQWSNACRTFVVYMNEPEYHWQCKDEWCGRLQASVCANGGHFKWTTIVTLISTQRYDKKCFIFHIWYEFVVFNKFNFVSQESVATCSSYGGKYYASFMEI